MILQTMPPSGSCILYAAAMCLGFSPEALAHRIGHDGSAIQWPDAFGCQRLRGVLLDEINDAIEISGYIFATRHFMPMAQNGLPGCEPRTINGNLEARARGLLLKRGILIGKTGTGILHAVAVEASRQYNPGNAEIEAFQTYHPLCRYDSCTLR